MQALASYDQAIRLFQQGRLQEAVHSLEQAIRFRPDFADAHCNLANILSYQGRLDEAVVSYRRALELVPHFTIAHSNLGNVLKAGFLATGDRYFRTWQPS
jgi:Flp pilus assembly protein TadD